jgi:outer membrane murein-binding lipoprotein Lpp
MKLMGHTFLGLSVGERRITAAEVTVRADRREVRKVTEFAMPPELSWAEPEKLGDALRQHLRLNHFSASRAIVGVPARWIIAQEKELPPSSPAIAANMLRLQAERLFSLEPGDLVFDYAGQPDSRNPTRVMLVAITRHRLEAIQRMADAAGLSLLAVTPSALALAAAQGGASGPVLAVWPDGAELAVRGEGLPRILRHLPVAAVAVQGGASSRDVSALGSEVLRVVALFPQNGGGDRCLTMWDAAGLGDEAARVLGNRIGMTVSRHEDLSSLGIAANGRQVGDMPRFAAAAALALVGAGRETGVDFLHSRLAEPKVRRISRRTAWLTLGGLALAAAIGWLLIDVQGYNSQIAAFDAERAQRAEQLKAAERVAARVTHAENWYRLRAHYLECLLDITRAFPPDRVFVTLLVLRERQPQTGRGAAPQPQAMVYRGELQGRAADAGGPAAVARNMQEMQIGDTGRKKFPMVSLGRVTDIAQSSEKQFTITFEYQPE